MQECGYGIWAGNCRLAVLTLTELGGKCLELLFEWVLCEQHVCCDLQTVITAIHGACLVNTRQGFGCDEVFCDTVCIFKPI